MSDKFNQCQNSSDSDSELEIERYNQQSCGDDDINNNKKDDEEQDEEDDISQYSDNSANIGLKIEEHFLYGCKHYFRRCRIISPCCKRIYSCRLCHDEDFDNNTDGHKLDRFKIEYVICNKCYYKQKIQQYCESCHTCFGLYYCEICHLFDDISANKQHCSKCGICRKIPEGDNLYHCDKCEKCIALSQKESHPCFSLKDKECMICIDSLNESISPATFLRCGHVFHRECLLELGKNTFKCPICSRAFNEEVLKSFNKAIEIEINNIQMHPDLTEKLVEVLCNECYHKQTSNFHIVGYKCENCGCYNTRLR